MNKTNLGKNAHYLLDDKEKVYKLDFDCFRFYDYLIHSDGWIFSFKEKKIIKTYISNSGYEMCTVHILDERYKISIHRLIAYYFIKNDDGENKIYINHIDGNRLNNHHSNLEGCTASGNMKSYHNKKRSIL